MSNPSYDYQQYVLANLPNDIAFNVNGKDGQFTFNKMKFANFPDALHMKWYLQNNGYTPEPEGRILLSETEDLGFSAHSFLYQAVAPGDYGKLGEYWTGDLNINYAEFSSLKQRWDLNGVDRTGNYSGALVLTEIGDLETGLADPSSTQGIETLQYLYWYTLMAQSKGCKFVGIYIPHSPEGVNFDADALSKVQYWINWLTSKPEVTIPVYAIPVPVMVREMIEQFNPVIPPYLNDPAAVVTGLVVDSVSETAIDLSIAPVSSRRVYALPAPPVGSVVSFDITFSGSGVYLVLDDETEFNTPRTQLWASTSAGTYSVEVTIPETTYPIMGFLFTGSVDTQITNWQVKAPYTSIYADGLHLKTEVYGAPNQMNNAMGQMVKMFLTGERPETNGNSTGPYLNDQDAIFGAGVTVNSVSGNALSYTASLGASAYYSIPKPPTGSVVEFDLTSDKNTYLRLDLEGDGTSPNYTDLVSGGFPAGTHHVTITIPDSTYPWFCFKHASNANTQITNWRVIEPWNAELIGLVDTAWDILQDYEMTGLGGSTVVAPYPVASDPLPNPSPLPS